MAKMMNSLSEASRFSVCLLVGPHYFMTKRHFVGKYAVEFVGIISRFLAILYTSQVAF